MEQRGPEPRPARAALSVAAVVASAAVVLGAAAPGFAAGAGRRVTGGRSGRALGRPLPPGTGSLASVSCTTAGRCWAVGSAASGSSTTVVDATTDGGRSWRAARVRGPGTADLRDVDCAGRRFCMAVGAGQAGGGLVLVARGTRWKTVHAPSGATGLVAVDCAAPSRCTVVASQGAAYWAAATVDGGAVWQRLGTLPAGFAGISSLTCTTSRHCMAAGYLPTTPGHGAGAVAASGDGGMTWAAATLPTGAGPLHDVSCPAPTQCLAAGTRSTSTIGVAQGQGEMLVSSDGGDTWTTAAAPAGVADAFGLACPSTATCTVVGTGWTADTPPAPTGAVATSTDAGGSWRAAAGRYLPLGLTSVACPSTTRCVAAGNDVLATVTVPPAPRRPRRDRARRG